MSLPRWKIDDTTRPGRVFCEHTQYPRFIGELLSNDKAPKVGVAMPAPGNRWLCKIRWIEDVEEGVHYEEQDMYDSLEAALKAHHAAKAQAPSTAAG
jgi:uncharacterized protein (DUF2237 family)